MKTDSFYTNYVYVRRYIVTVSNLSMKSSRTRPCTWWPNSVQWSSGKLGRPGDFRECACLHWPRVRGYRSQRAMVWWAFEESPPRCNSFSTLDVCNIAYVKCNRILSTWIYKSDENSLHRTNTKTAKLLKNTRVTFRSRRMANAGGWDDKEGEDFS